MEKQGTLVDAAEVRATAELARLALDEAELAQLGGELSAMLGYVAQLGELEVNGVVPMTHPVALACPLRADVVGAHDELLTALRNAPAAEPPYFSVPEIFAAREPATSVGPEGEG